MKLFLSLLAGLLFSFQVNAQIGQTAQTAATQNFDNDWRFFLGGNQGSEAPELDDAGWRKVDLPHDWSIEDRPGTASPFDIKAISQVNEGFTTQGTAWYRKTFVENVAAKGKRIMIQFDGVYMNSSVYINGHLLGTHPYGYTSFYYDITDDLIFGQRNVIAVQVQNEGLNSRWYSGSGIYRHVWLKTMEPVHISVWGNSVATKNITTKSALILHQTQLVNDTKTEVSLLLITRYILKSASEGGKKEIAKTSSQITLKPGTTQTINDSTKLENPALWSFDSPSLYQAMTEIYQNGKLTSKEITDFGIRSITIDVAHGFLLNGQAMKLKGGCFHNDNGPLGSKAYDRAEERKVELLKASGFNAIRCSHNPPSPAFLNACDRLGMLVIDEAFDCWNQGKNPLDYHLYFKDWWQRDLESMVLRDRNHPSVILWSVGNEIPEKATPLGVETARMLVAEVHKLDPTRLVTAAVDDLRADKDPFFAALDIAGYNYAAGGSHGRNELYAEDHARLPRRIMLGSETYPLQAFDSWMSVVDHPYVIGDFVWTAWDYIGEASIGWLGYPQTSAFYPWNLAFCGDIDLDGNKRPQSYYRDALWKANQLSLFVKPPVPSYPDNVIKATWAKWNWDDVLASWNWPGSENKPLAVTVYSSCEEVELLLNNKSLGKKAISRASKYMASWNVPYQAGELKAIGYTNGKQIAVQHLITAAAPTAIRLKADRTDLKADNQDLSYVSIELTDKAGNIDPNAENQITFSVRGDATIVGVGNANPRSVESYQQPARKAWQGRCLLIIKAGKTAGKIQVIAESPGLAPAQFSLLTR